MSKGQKLVVSVGVVAAAAVLLVSTIALARDLAGGFCRNFARDRYSAMLLA